MMIRRSIVSRLGTNKKFSSLSENIQIRLASRPVGMVTPNCFSIHREGIPRPSTDGDVLVEVSHISLDPAMRGWMNDAKSYIRPIAIGDVFRANGIGRVLESQNPQFAVGDFVVGGFGVQKYALMDAKSLPRAGVAKVDLSIATASQWLNILGMIQHIIWTPQLTAYLC